VERSRGRDVGESVAEDLRRWGGGFVSCSTTAFRVCCKDC
jgi:hypothetical protein